MYAILILTVAFTKQTERTIFLVKVFPQKNRPYPVDTICDASIAVI